MHGGRGAEENLERTGTRRGAGEPRPVTAARRCSEGDCYFEIRQLPLRGAGCQGQVSLPLAVNLQYSL